ncbi:MAG: TolC family protein [Hyphomonadaceae bacterium]|nr:TolC family protein [Hyphomonadaceae bacterium]
MISRISWVLLAASLSGCATYHAAPLAPAEIAARATDRGFDVEAVRAELARLAPNAAWDGQSWNRLTLLAAAAVASPTLAESRAHAQSATAAARAARARPSVTLTLTAEYARNAPESSPWLYGLTSDAPLDVGARRGARIGSADFAAIAAHYDYAEAVWAARMAIRRALADRFLATREVQIGEELTRLRARQLTALERRFQAGEATRSELERVRAEAAGDARRFADAQARLIAARVALAQALGVSTAALESAPLAWDAFDAPSAASDAEIIHMRNDALLARADILRAAAAYDQAEADLRGEVARQWPEIHLGPGYTWERGLVKLPFSIGLVLPQLDFAHNGVRAAEAHRAEAGAHLEAVIAGAQAGVDGALAERTAARANLARVRNADLRAARLAADQSDQEIESGAIDRVDWAAAQVGLRLAQLGEVDALRRVHAADAGMEDALRRPLEGPELAMAPAAGDKR